MGLSWRDWAAHIYIINASLLIAHEIDAGYWHEWEQFGMPGGLKLFLEINIVLMVLVLWGLVLVARWQPGAKLASYVLAGIGVFAFAIHTFLLGRGDPYFNDPLSTTLLIFMLLVSVLQVAVVWRLPVPDAPWLSGRDAERARRS